MPAIIPIAAGLAATAATAAGTAGLISTTLALALSVGFSVVGAAAQFLTQRQARRRAGTRFGSASASSAELGSREAQQSLRASDGPRRIIVGRARVAAGAHPVFDSNGANKFLRLMCLHHGETNGFQKFELSGQEVTLDGSGYVTGSDNGKWDGLIRILTADGDPNQSAISALVSAYTPWTSAHRVRGTAMAFVEQTPVAIDDKRANDANRLHELHVTMDGDRIHDPRTGTTVWSDNAALVLRHYLTHPDGFRLPASRIDDAAFSIAADRCDELITLAGGGTVRRYRAQGAFTLDEERNAIAEAMLENMNGYRTFDSQGRVGVRIGTAPVTNLLTFSEDQVWIERLNPGRRLKTFRNSFVGLFNAEDHNYQSTTSPAQEDAGSVAALGRRQETLNLRFCPHNNQAQRLCRIKMKQAAAESVGELVTDLSGVNAKPGDTILLNYPSAMTDLPLRVVSRELDLVEGRVRFQVHSIAPDEEDWQTSFEVEAQEMPVLPDFSSILPTPTNVQIGAAASNVSQTTLGLLAEVSWVSPNDSSIVAEVEIAQTSNLNWFGKTTVRANQGSVEIGGAQDGVAYSGRVRFIGSGGRSTDYVQVNGGALRVTSLVLSAPSISASASSIDAGNPVTITVTAQNSVSVGTVIIRANGIDVHTQSIGAGATISQTFVPAAGSVSYTAVLVNVSGIEGTESSAVVVAVLGGGGT
mgnify:CR=1 FL=1